MCMYIYVCIYTGRTKVALVELPTVNMFERKTKTKPKNGSGLCSKVCCNNLLTVYQIRTAPSKVAPGTMYEPLALTADRCMEGDRGERLPQGRLTCTLRGSPREEGTKTEP